MPLNLELQKSQQEQALDELLKRRITGLPSDIEGIRSKVEGVRDLSAPVSPFLSGLGIQPSGLSGLDQFQSNRLSRELSRRLASSRFQRGRGLLSLQGENAGRRADEALASRRDSENFARVQQRLAQRQAFQSGESAKNRQASLERQSMAEDFGNRRIAMENAAYDAMAGDQYSNAMARLLSGLVGGVGTAYLLRNYHKTPATVGLNPRLPVAGQGGYDPYDLYYGRGGTAGEAGYGVGGR